MKKILSYCNLFALFFGVAGFGLRYWLVTDGPDSKGLLQSLHIAGILLWIVTAAALIFPLIFFRGIKPAGRYGKLFPASLPAAAGMLAAAMGMGVTGIATWGIDTTPLTRLCAILGVVSALCLVVAAVCRAKGKRPTYLLFTALTIFFMVYLINQYRVWSAEPMLNNYIFPLMALVSLMLTSYHQATADAGVGNLRTYLLYNLASAYFCCIAIPGSSNWLMYFTMLLYYLTNLFTIQVPNRVPTQKA